MESTSTVGEVAGKVRNLLQNHAVAGIALEVLEDEIRWRDGWWHVVVRPSEWPKKRYEYYEALAEIEEDLQENEHLNVLIATGEPISETIAA
jgi:hypothetical protein